MTKSMQAVQADFDRIALLKEPRWNHNLHYHDDLLRHLPPSMDSALEVGSGTGQFARLLAARSRQVLALDLSAVMLREAHLKSAVFPNITYQQADILTTELPANHFDAIVSIATLHHLNLDDVLPRLIAALKPGGVLQYLDLYEVERWQDYALSALAAPLSFAFNLRFNGYLMQPAEQRAVWDAHGADERYLTLSQVRAVAARWLPGAHIRQHLFWRYSVIWRKALQ